MKETGNGLLKQDVTILFVEDDANDVILVSRAISRSEIPAAVQFVHNPLELQNYLLGQGKFSNRTQYPVPEVIMTDYRFGCASAREVICWLKGTERFKNIPVVVLSSFVPPREIEAMLCAGAKAYLEKPVDFDAFCKMLQSAMRLARN